MFFFDLLFGKQKNAAPPIREPAIAAASVPAAEVASAPGTHIHHDPVLIVSLKEDHRRLLTSFRSITAASVAGELVAVQDHLSQFQTMIMDHLLKENVRLYVYLEHLLQNDPVSHEMMHGFRHEMDGIGRVVVGFLTKYKAIASQPELAAAFSTDLKGIGQPLLPRTNREEDILYPP